MLYFHGFTSVIREFKLTLLYSIAPVCWCLWACTAVLMSRQSISVALRSRPWFFYFPAILFNMCCYAWDQCPVESLKFGLNFHLSLSLWFTQWPGSCCYKICPIHHPAISVFNSWYEASLLIWYVSKITGDVFPPWHCVSMPEWFRAANCQHLSFHRFAHICW